jgi:N-acetylmuramoyl-L-alanine amidase
MRRVLAISLCLIASSAFPVEWKVLHERGHDYVSFTNVAQFYQFPNYTRINNGVSLRSDQRGIRAQAGTSELFINGVRFFTSLPILSNGTDDLISATDVSKLIEPVLRPSRIGGAQPVETIVIDPGHGGVDQGAANSWGNEKAFTLDVALRARDALLRDGYKVEMTRSSDTAVSLDERVNFANRFTRAVLISIHFNSSTGGTGLETYALAPEGTLSNASSENHATVGDVQWYPGNARDGANIALAAAVHACALRQLNMNDRGIRHARFHVLRGVNIPALLVEGGFLSDAMEGQRIATPQFRQQFAEAIAQGVKIYNTAVNYHGSAPAFAMARLQLPPHSESIAEPLRTSDPQTKASPPPTTIAVPGE